MPIYEYRCNACGKVVSVFQRSMNTAVAAACDGCRSNDLSRLISRFSFRRSIPDADDGFDDAMMDDLDENDPQSVARWARRMGDQMGEDLGPEFDDMVGRMEAGESFDDDGDEGFDDDF
jgi:putative FmdB family regulatory protein